MASLTLPFWWKHRETSRESDRGGKGRTTSSVQNWCPVEVMSREDVHRLKDASGWECDLSGFMHLYMCVPVCVYMCLPGEEGSQLRELGTRIDMCRSLAEHDIVRNLRGHSAAWLSEFESQLPLLKPG